MITDDLDTCAMTERAATRCRQVARGREREGGGQRARGRGGGRRGLRTRG